MVSVLSLLRADPQFSMVLGLVARIDDVLNVGLAETLDDPHLNATFLAPTDAALADAAVGLGYAGETSDGVCDYLAAATDILSGGREAAFLAEVILYHITPGVPVEDGALPTLIGQDMALEGGEIRDAALENAPALMGQAITAENGLLIPIDRLLMPVQIELEGDAEALAPLVEDDLGLSDELAVLFQGVADDGPLNASWRQVWQDDEDEDGDASLL